MDLSVIIVNWHSAAFLRRCLTSLYSGLNGIQFEVIVVDNASYDGSERLIREHFPQVIFIQSDQNLGFARANNLGHRRSSGDVLLFLNPDTEIVANALLTMLSYLRCHPLAGAVGARLLNSDGTLQTSCITAFPTIWNQILDFDILRRLTRTLPFWGMRALFHPSPHPADVDAISGACFMVTRHVFETAGLFGEGYFMYSDDLDLSYRIHLRGYAITYMNNCQVVHHGSGSSAQRGPFYSDIQQRQSLFRFFRTTRGHIYAYTYRAAMACVSIVRLILLVCVIPLGGLGVEGKNVPLALHKWSTILCWAVGKTPSPSSTGMHDNYFRRRASRIP